MKNFIPILAITHSDIAGAVLFYLFAAMTAFSAIGVVASCNIVRTAVFLLFTLTGVAGLYFLLDAEFLAAAQLVIYAGGTLILIVFGVMLTSKSPFSRFEPSRGEIVVALLLGIVLLASLVLAILHTGFAHSSDVSADGYPIGLFGQALLGDYLVPFELVSILLLVAMIGAAYLAKRRRPKDTTEGKPSW